MLEKGQLGHPTVHLPMQVSADMASGGDMEKLMGRMEKLQTELDACNGWELDRQLEVRVCASSIFIFIHQSSAQISPHKLRANHSTQRAS